MAKNSGNVCCGGDCSGCSKGMCGAGCGSDCGASNGCGNCGGCGTCGGVMLTKKVVMIVALMALIPWLLSSASLNFAERKQVGKLPLERHTITVTADDKVAAVPDLAVINVGLTTDGNNIATIQQDNTKKFNDLLAKLKEMGIAEKDLQTSGYSIQPRYDWNNGRQTLLGYTVSQNVEVKIRDLSKAGDVLQAAGMSGANQVSGINFMVDNADAYQASARESAVAKAKAKAVEMAEQAGFKLGKIVNFSENTGGAYPMPYYVKEMAMSDMAGNAAPSIQAGTQDIVSNVALTFEIE